MIIFTILARSCLSDYLHCSSITLTWTPVYLIVIPSLGCSLGFHLSPLLNSCSSIIPLAHDICASFSRPIYFEINQFWIPHEAVLVGLPVSFRLQLFESSWFWRDWSIPIWWVMPILSVQFLLLPCISTRRIGLASEFTFSVHVCTLRIRVSFLGCLMDRLTSSIHRLLNYAPQSLEGMIETSQSSSRDPVVQNSKLHIIGSATSVRACLRFHFQSATQVSLEEIVVGTKLDSVFLVFEYCQAS